MTQQPTHRRDAPWLLLLLVAVVCFGVGNCTGFRAGQNPPAPRNIWPAGTAR